MKWPKLERAAGHLEPCSEPGITRCLHRRGTPSPFRAILIPPVPRPQVASTTQQLQVALEQHLEQLTEVLAARADYLQTLKFLQQLSGNIVLQLSGLPSWHGVSDDLTALAANVSYVEYYR